MRLSDRIASALALDTFEKRHKIGLLLLTLAMIAIISVWVIKLRTDIITPLYASRDTQQTNPVSNQEAQTQADLKAKDTDGDGLNDWDELNVYKTSPYLADTDSDTFDDKKEIESGNDPTCPQGQTCAVTTTPTTDQPDAFNNPTLNNLLNPTTPTTITQTISPTVSPTTSSATLSEQEKKALRDSFGTNADPKILRQLLAQAGMDQKTLDALSDSQITATFNEMIQ